MKIKAGLLIMFMFAGILMANAQGGGGGMRRTVEERTKRVVDTITTVFKLDNNLAAQAQTVFTDYYKESDKLRESMQQGNVDRSQFQKLAADRDEKLKKVLSEEQFKKFKDEIEPALRGPRRQQ